MTYTHNIITGDYLHTFKRLNSIAKSSLLQVGIYNLNMFTINVSLVAGDPTLESLHQTSSTAVKVKWSPPSGGATVTGYVVHYKTGSFVETKNESNSTNITGLIIGVMYTISVEATSQHLSGESETMTISLRELILL